jgi:hypothetical protein
MPHTDKEKLQAFARKMHDEGANGFADGPRPWEQWDESGSQAGTRVWEGSARRVPVKQRPARSTGDRLLSAMATIALATLVIGIGGVYFSEYPEQQLAQTGIQPPPIVLTPIRRTPREQHASRTVPAPAPVAATINTHETVPAPVASDTLQNNLAIPGTSPVADSADMPDMALDLALAYNGADSVTEAVAPAQEQATPVTDISPETSPEASPEIIMVETATETVEDIPGPQQDILAEADIPIIVLQRIVPVTRPRQDPMVADTVATENVTESQEVAIIETTAQSPAPAQVTAVAEEHIEALNKLEPPAAKAGGWVVNLASYTWKSTANKKIEEFRSKGVDAELVTVTINDKPMHRVRVAGFGSSRLAKQQISSLEQKLDLDGAWISRR